MAINTSPIAQQSEVVKMVLYAYQADGSLAPATISGGGGGSGTVTSVATSSPITGGPISTTGTIGCPTCTTNAAALTANALVIGGGLQAASALGSLGTTTTVLHGNAAGAPTFGAINLAADVSGQLPISAVGSSGLTGSSPITISAAGAIACATCNTSASAITSNVLPKGSGGAQGLTNSSITDNGTTISTALPIATTSTISSGANSGTAGQITLFGSTSGSTTLTAAANGGTITASAGFSVTGSFTASTVNATSEIQLNAKRLITAAAPTISSGFFGTAPSIVSSSGQASFRVNVGTGTAASSGVVALASATTNWNCQAYNLTAHAGARTDDTVVTASTTNTVTLQNRTIATSVAANWTASDVIVCNCFAN